MHGQRRLVCNRWTVSPRRNIFLTRHGAASTAKSPLQRQRRLSTRIMSRKRRGSMIRRGRTEEADKGSARIAQILSEKSFNFSPSHLVAIHGRLFERIFACVGKIRDYDISKPEWVLDGDSVIYGAAFELRAALDYDFEQERKFSYKNLGMEETVKHIAFFVSRIWQIHAFGEGNTRTTAVFAIKYLRSLGFAVDNDVFAENAWYFRNALVRANYTNLQAGIEETPEFLEKFFRNFLMGERNELKNRLCHIGADKNGC